VFAELRTEDCSGKPILSLVGSNKKESIFLRSLPVFVRQGGIALKMAGKKRNRLSIFEIWSPEPFYVGPDVRKVRRIYNLKIGNDLGTAKTLAGLIESAGLVIPIFEEVGFGKATFDCRETPVILPYPKDLFSRRLD
jgi:hypothetical protein